LDSFVKNSFDYYNKLPVVDKAFIKTNYDKLFDSNISQKYQKKKTGGSTGEPFFYHLSLDSISHSWAFILFCWSKYANYKLGDKFVTIAGNSLKPSNKKIFEFAYYWLQNNYFLNSDILNLNISISRSSVKEAKLIYGYPSSINYLVNNYKDFNSYFPKLTAVFTTSETLLPSVRKNIESYFGVPLFDIYGANDGGIISCECPEHNGYHYNMLNSYVEVSDMENQGPELLLTNLNSFSLPFIKYRVGDMANISSEPCKCGSPFQKIVNLKGRTRDLVFIPSEGYVHGSIFNSIFYSITEIQQYKIIQKTKDNFEIKILVPNEHDFNLTVKKLKSELLNVFPTINYSVSRLDIKFTQDKKIKVIESYV
jgi:phenylacetate-CoA ligase